MRSARVLIPVCLLLALSGACRADVAKDAADGKVEAVSRYLDSGGSVDWHFDRGRSLLDIAIRSHRAKIVKILLEHGANMNDPYPPGPPLHEAAAFGTRKIVAMLLAKGVEPDARDGRGRTPLHAAAAAGNVDIARFLLDRGVYEDAVDRWGRMPLHEAALGHDLKMIRLLIERGAKVQSRDCRGLTPLHYAAQLGSPEVVSVLLEKDAPIDARGADGVTPLLFAVWRSRPEVVKLLLERGADAAAADDEGRAPIHVAAHVGDLELVRLLLAHGASAIARTRGRQTPPHLAVSAARIAPLLSAEREQRALATVKLLLDKAGGPNAYDANGETPLFRASGPAARLLLLAGANPNACDVRGENVLHRAVDGAVRSWEKPADRASYASAVRVLLASGADPDSLSFGRTPLHDAVVSPEGLGTVRLLLDAGADAGLRDNNGHTPADLASLCGNEEIARVLHEHERK